MKTRIMQNVMKVFTLLLIVALAILSFVDRKIFNNDSEVKTLIDARKVIINDADNKYIDSLTKTLKSNIKVNDEKLVKTIDALKLENKKDESLKKLVDTKNEEILQLSENNLIEYKNSKNKVVFEYESHKIQSQPNIWLILLIILGAGIIGGWARMNYSLLLPLKSNLEELEKKMIAILAKIKSGITSGDDAKDKSKISANAVSQAQADTTKLAKEIRNILDEIPDASERLNTSIVFGIIASFISILALKLADSQILEFANDIDYFILAAWCLLGAVYAKDTLERLYNSRFPKKS